MLLVTQTLSSIASEPTLLSSQNINTLVTILSSTLDYFSTGSDSMSSEAPVIAFNTLSNLIGLSRDGSGSRVDAEVMKEQLFPKIEDTLQKTLRFSLLSARETDSPILFSSENLVAAAARTLGTNSTAYSLPNQVERGVVLPPVAANNSGEHFVIHGFLHDSRGKYLFSDRGLEGLQSFG